MLRKNNIITPANSLTHPFLFDMLEKYFFLLKSICPRPFPNVYEQGRSNITNVSLYLRSVGITASTRPITTEASKAPMTETLILPGIINWAKYITIAADINPAKPLA